MKINMIGSVAVWLGCSIDTDVIADELAISLGREPSADEIAEAVYQAHESFVDSIAACSSTHSLAQASWQHELIEPDSFPIITVDGNSLDIDAAVDKYILRKHHR